VVAQDGEVEVDPGYGNFVPGTAYWQFIFDFLLL
jgi:hypothetical protein